MAILAATSAALIEVGVAEVEVIVVEALTLEERTSWAAIDVVGTVELDFNVVEATVGSLDEVLLKPITWTLNAAAGVEVTIGLFEVELGTAELEGTLLEATEVSMVEVGSTFATEAEEVAVLILVTVTVVVIVDVVVTISSSALATLGASGTNTRVTF